MEVVLYVQTKSLVKCNTMRQVKIEISLIASQHVLSNLDRLPLIFLFLGDMGSN